MSTLSIQTTELKRVMLLEVSGRIDSTTASELGDALNGVIEEGRNKIVLDLEKVDYMSSAGLREIVAALKRLNKGTGDLRLACPSDRVREVLELAGLDEIFKIFDTQLEAVGSFT